METKRNMTKKEREWVDEFKNLLNKIPKGIEVIVNNSSIRIFESGSLSKHIGSEYDGWDISANDDVKNSKLYSIKNRGNILPYSEGQ